nr:hypothetical protein [Hyphomonas sp. Mor2]
MDQETQIIMARVAKVGEMTEAEAHRIVNEIYADGIVSRGEAETLFRLNETLSATNPEWGSRFREALTDFLITREAPEGWVTDEEADWLLGQVHQDGQHPDLEEIDLLIAVLRKADGVPARLAHYTLDAIAHRIVEAGKATAAMVERVRFALFAGAGDGGLWVSQHEAGVLFATNDAIASADNDASWNDLFARAVGNHLMARAHPEPKSIEEAFEREAWLKDTSVNPGSMFARMGASFFSGEWFASVTYDPKKAEKARMIATEAAAREAEKITDEETAWVLAGVDRDGVVSPAEQALIDFLRAEAPGLAEGLASAA